MACCLGNTKPVYMALVCGVLQWMVVVPLANRVLQKYWLIGSLATASLFCIVELFVWHCIPIFGSAQCFARVTSAFPQAIQFASVTGLIGVVFVLIFTQSVLAHCLRSEDRRYKLVAIGLLLGVLTAYNCFRWNRPLPEQATVAAIGWWWKDDTRFEEFCNQAKQADATIIVSPEMGFVIPQGGADETINGWAAILNERDLNGAVGAFSIDEQLNQIYFIDANGNCDAIYCKTHLIPYMENYQAGNGIPAIVHWSGIRCGGMICQDDNFDDLTRAYGRAGVQLMLVPTYDWAPIHHYHLESSIMRSIECGYGVVRATSGGISAHISPRGEVIASHDHVVSQQTVCLAGRLSAGDGSPTIYSRFGDWPIGIMSVILLLTSMTKRNRFGRDDIAPAESTRQKKITNSFSPLPANSE